jgi:hypothetical protein
MIRPEHQFDIRSDLRKAASTKAESVIRPKQLVRITTAPENNIQNVGQRKEFFTLTCLPYATYIYI